MKILITGATGYVGSSLIDDLRANHEIIATARSVSRISQKGIKKLELDILSAEQAQEVISAEQPDIVIHAAALPKRSHAGEEEFIATNVSGATNIARAVAQYSNAKLIMISSGCAFKQVPERLILEGSEREMGTSFSKSKNFAELAVERAFEGCSDRLSIIYPPVILHPSQQKGVIVYALEDVCREGIIHNKVPNGHVNFVTHKELASIIEAIAMHPSQSKRERYMLTGNRCKTEDFFLKLQRILRETFNICCEIETSEKPAFETMCAMDESNIRTLIPEFNWNGIDEMILEIIAQNLKNRDDISIPSTAKLPERKSIIR